MKKQDKQQVKDNELAIVKTIAKLLEKRGAEVLKIDTYPEDTSLYNLPIKYQITFYAPKILLNRKRQEVEVMGAKQDYGWRVIPFLPDGTIYWCPDLNLSTSIPNIIDILIDCGELCGGLCNPDCPAKEKYETLSR